MFSTSYQPLGRVFDDISTSRYTMSLWFHVLHCIPLCNNISHMSFLSTHLTVTQQFKVVPQPKHTLYSHSATFDCESIGIPTPQISWRRKLNATHSTPIHVDLMKYMVFPNHTLRINDVDYGDEGTYVCVSESPRLIKESGAELTIYGIRIHSFCQIFS